MNHFAFLRAEWPAVHEAAARAEAAAVPDPRTACFYARRALELLVHWAYKHDPALRLPHQDTLSALIHEPTFKAAAGDAVFAHAKFIVERFDIHYPHLKGEFARTVTYRTEYAQSLIDAFSQKDRPPHIAVSVDMLDTGIDVPEVVNLVFFKRVYSKTKFWQMVGRGTRLCPNLFGPGKHKEFFCLFDYCGNLEYFGADPAAADGAAGESLGRRLFKARLDLVGALDQRTADPASRPDADPHEAGLRQDTAERLRAEVAAMNVDNFLVRPKRRLVEAYARPEAWAAVPASARRELAAEVAGLPAELPAEAEEAKRFDLLMLRLQLAVLLHEPAFERLRDQVKEIAGRLEEKAAIPMVKAQMDLIQAVQADDWWQDATAPMLETVRKRLRDLVRFIDKARRRPVYTDFVDELGRRRSSCPGSGRAAGSSSGSGRRPGRSSGRTPGATPCGRCGGPSG
ncbi:MAG: helicase-related protein [Gemmataceae bacterium]